MAVLGERNVRPDIDGDLKPPFFFLRLIPSDFLQPVVGVDVSVRFVTFSTGGAFGDFAFFAFFGRNSPDGFDLSDALLSARILVGAQASGAGSAFRNDAMRPRSIQGEPGVLG